MLLNFRSPHGPQIDRIASCGGSITLSRALDCDAPAILDLVNRESRRSGAVLKVSNQQVSQWIRNGSSFVAIDSAIPAVVAHMAVVKWPGCYEMRSVVVDGAYRGMGIYTSMSDAVISSIFDTDPHATVVMIKNENSGGADLIKKQGFVEVPLKNVLEMELVLQDPTGRRAFVLDIEAYRTMVFNDVFRR